MSPALIAGLILVLMGLIWMVTYFGWDDFVGYLLPALAAIALVLAGIASLVYLGGVLVLNDWGSWWSAP